MIIMTTKMHRIKHVINMFIDLRKAFDTVSHSVLLKSFMHTVLEVISYVRVILTVEVNMSNTIMQILHAEM